MISDRVAEETVSDAAEYEGRYIVDRSRGLRFRIYEAVDGYSQTSGGTSKKGKVVRNHQDVILTFPSAASAVDYIRQHLAESSPVRQAEKEAGERIRARIAARRAARAEQAEGGAA
jgi:hypothetical protein